MCHTNAVLLRCAAAVRARRPREARPPPHVFRAAAQLSRSACLGAKFRQQTMESHHWSPADWHRYLQSGRGGTQRAEQLQGCDGQGCDGSAELSQSVRAGADVWAGSSRWEADCVCGFGRAVGHQCRLLPCVCVRSKQGLSVVNGCLWFVGNLCCLRCSTRVLMLLQVPVPWCWRWQPAPRESLGCGRVTAQQVRRLMCDSC